MLQNITTEIYICIQMVSQNVYSTHSKAGNTNQGKIIVWVTGENIHLHGSSFEILSNLLSNQLHFCHLKIKNKEASINVHPKSNKQYKNIFQANIVKCLDFQMIEGEKKIKLCYS